LRQSNPSILTAAGLSPKLVLTHPPLRDAEFGDGTLDDGDVDMISSPKRASWTKGFAARTGGDTQKYGGDEAT
jgi:hypothetical protein